MCQWSAMEPSQPTTWTTNRNLLMASHTMAKPGRPTNTDSTLPRATHPEGGMIWGHQCLHLALGKCFGICRHVTNPSWLCSASLLTTSYIPTPTKANIAMANYTHAPTVINSSAFHSQLWCFWGSSTGVCDKSTTTTTRCHTPRAVDITKRAMTTTMPGEHC